MSIDKEVLSLADFIYTKASLKPFSKTLFFISRIFLILKEFRQEKNLSVQNITHLNQLLLLDSDSDYNFEKILADLGRNADTIIQQIKQIYSKRCMDTIGEVFNSLLRGKFEAGEGLGTFLTPQEVVDPCVDLMESMFRNSNKIKDQDLFADITGGTGSFMLNAFSKLKDRVPASHFYIFDQSRVHLEFAKTNFKLNFNITPSIFYTENSLLELKLNKFKGHFKCLMTNPPFGQNKYQVCEKILLNFDTDILRLINVKSINDRTDPAWLFLIKNLDLLSNQGILVIVLPNGICQSEIFSLVLKEYEKKNNIRISIPYIFDLPVTTFSLGGTIAKTSILFISKDLDFQTKAQEINHIGFIKKGNKKVIDPLGNNLEKFVNNEVKKMGERKYHSKGKNWHHFNSLSPKIIKTNSLKKNHCINIGTLVYLKRNYFSGIPNSKHFHITVQDIDETGTINLINCSKFFPSTKPLTCLPFDVLISCLNPKIWRVCIIPDIEDFQWTCSPEFAVLRLKSGKCQDALKFFFAVQTLIVRMQVVALGKGTSSSRQRVKKEELLHISIPKIVLSDNFIFDYMHRKKQFYKEKLLEIKMINQLANNPINTSHKLYHLNFELDNL